MRDEFVRTLTRLAAADRNVMLITGDLGFGVLTQFARDFPGQFLNAGVAEQNMAGLATGMALEGKIVFTYSIGNFPTLRCLEQLRNGACYHQANVKVVAIGGGFAYGPLGISHHATEDIAIMRSLPNLTLLSPADPVEVAAATEAIYRRPGPCYLRLGRGGEPKLHESTPAFEVGKAIRMQEGERVALVATGGLLKNALEAARMLEGRGVRPAVYSMHTLKPIDSGCIESVTRAFDVLVTVEEHSIIGGLGGAVAEVMAGVSVPRARLVRVGLADQFSSIVGDQEYLRRVYGMSPEAIATAAWDALDAARLCA